MSKLNKFAVVFGIFILTAIGTYKISENYFDRQFRIIYSRDKKQNDQEIINLINNADKYIYFAVFTFTKDNIAAALIRAKQKGLIVWGLTDSGQAAEDYEKPILQRLSKAGVAVETQKHDDGIMHIKAIVTDKAYAMGSYNWTESATIANDELLEIGTNKNIHDRYFEILKMILITDQ